MPRRQALPLVRRAECRRPVFPVAFLAAEGQGGAVLGSTADHNSLADSPAAELLRPEAVRGFRPVGPNHPERRQASRFPAAPVAADSKSR